MTKPRTEVFTKACMACGGDFETNKPRATRCQPCVAAGKKAKPPRSSKEMFTRVCLACGCDHQTTKPKATRCQPCIDSGNKAKTVTCPACDADFPRADQERFCRSCREKDRTELRRSIFDKSHQQDLEEAREERRQRSAQKRRSDAAYQMAELERLGKRPKGYPAMTKETADSAIGLLWLTLCATEGATNCLLHDQSVDDETKGRLMTTFLRLRLKGFTSDSLSKVDPSALMKRDVAEVDRAIRELPKVEGEDPEDHEDDDDYTFDPLEDLEPDMKQELIEFQERQRRKELADRLGLSD
ncbi:MAG: hypothetical protein LC687_05775 [Actinobacteria bacterium]|nr:hypothetical protein [Actinomycetota bacterium]